MQSPGCGGPLWESRQGNAAAAQTDQYGNQEQQAQAQCSPSVCDDHQLMASVVCLVAG